MNEEKIDVTKFIIEKIIYTKNNELTQYVILYFWYMKILRTL